MKPLVFLIALSLLFASAHAAPGKAAGDVSSLCPSSSSDPFQFAADPNVQKVAEAYSLDAVDFARGAFGMNLDWSDESVGSVEKILTDLYAAKATDPPSDERVWTMSKMLGSYIGEVYRKNYGAEWGMVTSGQDKFPGMRTRACDLFWPWSKVEKRLTNGPEDNVWFYYQTLVPEPET